LCFLLAGEEGKEAEADGQHHLINQYVEMVVFGIQDQDTA
jgi:hypothetical protein